MKKGDRITTILLYAGAQAAWLCLLALWIYWFVRNYLIFIEVGERLSPQFVINTRNILALIIGIILLAAIMTSMTMLFNRLNKQMRLTRLYDNFIANVTHELKSPLASIQMYLETLESREVPQEKQKEFIGIMIKDTRRLETQIDTILELSGLEDRKKIFFPRLQRVDELIPNLCYEAAEALKLPDTAYSVTGNGACHCLLDEKALRVVFMNLFDNAVKYSSGQVRIDVTMQCAGKRLYLDVKDNGIGIPKRSRKEAFKKFRRLYHPGIPNVKGTGLGLYRVREIIRSHRGKIQVLNKDGEKGTTFRIELPVETTHTTDKKKKPTKKGLENE
ncbi:MAG: HAMP domain-containing histidine kinase [Spirochaetales bacterium]|nr:HAMP domain-containing histidine kinase [Spirochaetales bacterium]